MPNTKDPTPNTQPPKAVTKHQTPTTNHQSPNGMVFLIRADASFEIGTGHVMRCLALGQMLIDEGHQVIFLTQTDNQMIQERILKEGFGLITFCENDILKDAVYTVNACKDIKSDWVVTDGYKFTTEYQKIIKNAGFKLMCIDDVCECHYVSDIVLNQNLNANNIFNYSCEDYTELLLGVDYALLRREYYSENNFVRNIPSKCDKLLITIGGSDIQNNSLILLQAIENIISAIQIKVIIGSNFKFKSTIETFKYVSSNLIELVDPVDNIIDLFNWSDLTITGGGSTVWELIKTKTPFVTVITAKNQELIGKQIHNEGLGLNLGYIYNKEINETSEKIKTVIMNPKDRKSYVSAQSKIHIDGLKLFNHL